MSSQAEIVDTSRSGEGLPHALQAIVFSKAHEELGLIAAGHGHEPKEDGLRAIYGVFNMLSGLDKTPDSNAKLERIRWRERCEFVEDLLPDEEVRVQTIERIRGVLSSVIFDSLTPDMQEDLQLTIGFIDQATERMLQKR